MQKEKIVRIFALVYREDGKILLQKNHLSHTWNLLSVLGIEGVSKIEVLESTLRDICKNIPSSVNLEFSQLKRKADMIDIEDYFYSIKFVNNQNFLHKDQEMDWYSCEDIIELQLAPVMYENFSLIANVLKKIYPIKLQSIENKLLLFNNLLKKNDRVFYAKKNPFHISRQQIFLLKELAVLKHIPVFRVCMHTNDRDDIHEMLMIHVSRVSMGPLKQEKTSLSYHILEGLLKVKLYNEIGDQIEEYLLGRDDSFFENISLRLNANEYRSIHTNSEYAIFLEVASGPFKDKDTIWLHKL